MTLIPHAVTNCAGYERMAEWAWWLIVAILIKFITLQIVTDQRMSVILGQCGGLVITIRVTLAYCWRMIGLLWGLPRLQQQDHINIASFYVEVVHAPILVLSISLLWACQSSPICWESVPATFQTNCA
jgi:hypothetical protein